MREVVVEQEKANKKRKLDKVKATKLSTLKRRKVTKAEKVLTKATV